MLAFGKYKGRSVRSLADSDLGYALWLLAQPWLKEKFPSIYSPLRERVTARLLADIEEERAAAERVADLV